MSATLTAFVSALLRRWLLPTRVEVLRRYCARIGGRGEDAAAAYLENAGYDLLSRNFRPRRHHGELDVVARDPSGTLCVIEVKTRRIRRDGDSPRPLAAIDREKRQNLRRTAAAYLREAGGWLWRVRFDAIEVWADGGWPVQLLHWRGIFPPAGKSDYRQS